MDKSSVSYEEVKEVLMKDEVFKAEYEKLKPRYERISKCIESQK